MILISIIENTANSHAGKKTRPTLRIWHTAMVLKYGWKTQSMQLSQNRRESLKKNFIQRFGINAKDF